MQRLRAALESLDDIISTLEDRVLAQKEQIRAAEETQHKYAEHAKQVRARESGLMAVSQKVAQRLDETIEHVERILN